MDCCGQILAAFIKIILMFPLSVILAVLIVGLTLFALALLIVLTIILGMFPYAFKIICEAGGICAILLIILYPLPMFAGIAIAIS
jgi:hypothetical protein